MRADPQRYSKEQVVHDAEQFAKNHNLAEYSELFGRAALVARDDKDFENIPELTAEERTALAYERDHKWHGPKMLWFSITLCAVGAATQGESESGSSTSTSARLILTCRMGPDRIERCQLVIPC